MLRVEGDNRVRYWRGQWYGEDKTLVRKYCREMIEKKRADRF